VKRIDDEGHRIVIRSGQQERVAANALAGDPRLLSGRTAQALRIGPPTSRSDARRPTALWLRELADSAVTHRPKFGEVAVDKRREESLSAGADERRIRPGAPILRRVT
jgi:hypothetical protein